MSMRSKNEISMLVAGTAAAIVAIALLASGATAPTVSQTTLTAINADIQTVGSNFAYTVNGVKAVKAAAAALGDTSANAIEMDTANSVARTALTKADWMYEVVLKEAAAGSIASGTFTVSLYKDGTLSGTVFVKQATADSLNVEGNTIQFDIGATLPSGDTLFEVKVT